MASTIENRTVSMRFDNKDFKKKAQDTINTLSELGSAVNNFTRGGSSSNFNGITDTLNKIENHFTLLGLIGFNAMNKIADAAVDAGIKITKSMTTDNIMIGFANYERSNNAIRTLKNSMESKMTEEYLKEYSDSLSEAKRAEYELSDDKSMYLIEDKLKKLQFYSDETSYSNEMMYEQLSKFTSMDIDVDEAISTITGFGNAVSNAGISVSQSQSQFEALSRAIQLGYVDAGHTWPQLSKIMNSNFQQLAKETAVEVGMLKKVGDSYQTLDGKMEVTGANFKNTLSEKWFNTEVINKSLEKYSKFSTVLQMIKDENEDLSTEEGIQYLLEHLDEFGIDKFAADAFLAAQRARTFEDAVGSAATAAQAQWSKVFKNIFGNVEEAETFWTDVAEILIDVFTTPNEALVELSENLKNLGSFEKVFEGISYVFYTFVDLITYAYEGLAEIFNADFTKIFSEIAESFNEFASNLYLSDEFEKFGEKIKTISMGISSALSMVFKGIKYIYEVIEPLISIALNVALFITTILETIAKFIISINETEEQMGYFKNIFDLLSSAAQLFSNIINFSITGLDIFVERIKIGGEAFNTFGDLIYNLRQKVNQFNDEVVDVINPLSMLDTVLNTIFYTLDRITNYIGNKVKLAFEFLKNIFNPGAIYAILNTGILANTYKLLTKLSGAMTQVKSIAKGFTWVTESISDTFYAMSWDLTAFGKEMQSKALLNNIKALSIGLLSLAASLLIISIIDKDRLLDSIYTLISIISVIFAFSIILSKIKFPMIKAFGVISLITAIAASILPIAAALSILSLLDYEKLKSSFLILSGALAVISAFIIILGLLPLKHLGRIALILLSLSPALLSLSIAMLSIAGSLKIISTINEDQIKYSTIAILSIFSVLTLLTYLISFINPIKILSISAILSALSKALLSLSVAMLSISGAMMMISIIDSEKILPSFVALVSIIFIFSALVAVLSTIGPTSKGVLLSMSVALLSLSVAMLSSAAAMILISFLIKKLSDSILYFYNTLKNIDLLGFAKILVILSSMALVLTLLSPLLILAGISLLIFGAGLLVASLALNGIVSALTLFQGVLQSFNYMAGGLANSIIGFFSTIISNYDKIKSGIDKLLLDIIDAIKKYLPMIFDLILNTIANLLDALVEYAPIIFERVIDFIICLSLVISENLGPIINSAFSLLLAFLDGLAEAVDKNGDKILLAVGKLILAIVMSIGKFLFKIIDKGAELAANFIKGFTSKGKEEAKGAADEVTTEINKELDNNDFYEKGKSNAEDYYDGFIDEGKKDAKNAAGEVINEFNGEIAKKGNFIDHGDYIEYKPYIDSDKKTSKGEFKYNTEKGYMEYTPFSDEVVDKQIENNEKMVDNQKETTNKLENETNKQIKSIERLDKELKENKNFVDNGDHITYTPYKDNADEVANKQIENNEKLVENEEETVKKMSAIDKYYERHGESEEEGSNNIKTSSTKEMLENAKKKISEKLNPLTNGLTDGLTKNSTKKITDEEKAANLTAEAIRQLAGAADIYVKNQNDMLQSVKDTEIELPQLSEVIQKYGDSLLEINGEIGSSYNKTTGEAETAAQRQIETAKSLVKRLQDINSSYQKSITGGKKEVETKTNTMKISDYIQNLSNELYSVKNKAKDITNLAMRGISQEVLRMAEEDDGLLAALKSASNKEISQYVALFNSKVDIIKEATDSTAAAEMMAVSGQYSNVLEKVDNNTNELFNNSITEDAKRIKANKEYIDSVLEEFGIDDEEEIKKIKKKFAKQEIISKSDIKEQLKKDEFEFDEGEESEDDYDATTEGDYYGGITSEALIYAGKSMVENVGEGIEEDHQPIIDGMTSALNSGIDTANEFLSKKPKESESVEGGPGAGSLGNPFYNIGYNISAGIAEGIYAGISLIENAMRMAMQAAESSGEEEGEINSPSRMTSRLGVFLDQGLAVGLKEGIGYVKDASKESMSEAINSFKNEANGFSRVINSGMFTENPFNFSFDSLNKGTNAYTSERHVNGILKYMSNQNDGENFDKSNSKGQVTNNYTFTQNNTSPKSLNATEIYRQTKNLYSYVKEVIDNK